jgi:hypothetical protein
MNDNTRNLSKFGYRELDMAAELLEAIKNGLPEDFEDDGIAVEFNPNSGCVFLVNNNYQTAMVDEGKLYSFYSTPYEGLEGSFEDLAERYDDMHQEDKEYMHSLAEYYPNTKLPELKSE